MREYDKMIAGEMYDPTDPELMKMRSDARELLDLINASTKDIFGDDPRAAVCRKLFGGMGKNCILQPPFYCDYGRNIRLGDNVFLNFNCIMLDVAEVTIGSYVMFGPNVQIYTATHPLDSVERNSGREGAKPIVINDYVWVGGSAVICPGITIGERSVIAAGAVVTKDVPPRVLVGGSPARIIKHIS